MKTITKITAAALIASVLGASLVEAATATGTATASVIGPLSLVQTTALSFGSISPSATAGTVNHYGQTTGGVSSVGVNARPAVFTATGTPSTNFNITSSPSVVLSNGVQSMTAALTVPAQSATNSTGSGVFNVTGVLSVAANQAAGNYTGTYTVTVNY